MTDQEFSVIRDELHMLGTGLKKAVCQIVEQEAEIRALRSIIEQKGLATQAEMDEECDIAVRQLTDSLRRPDSDDLRQPDTIQ